MDNGATPGWTGAATPGETPGPKKQRSRWDETPVNTGMIGMGSGKLLDVVCLARLCSMTACLMGGREVIYVMVHN